MPQRRSVARRLFARRPPILALFWLLVLVLLAIAPGLFAPHNPYVGDLEALLTPPFFKDGGSTAHFFGTDTVGRDILSRIIYGTRSTLKVVAMTLAVAGAVGLALGLLAGYVGGIVDGVIMRLADAAMSIPIFLVALVLAVTHGPSELNVVLVIAGLMWAQYARVIRAETLGVVTQDFVAAARSIGCKPPRILFRHILPHTFTTLIVLLTTQAGSVVLIVAALGFLGAGVPPPAPEWGSLIADGRSVLISGAWWASTAPGLALVITVLSMNSLGDWLTGWLRRRGDPAASYETSIAA